LNHKEIYEQAKWNYITKDSFAYQNDPESFERGFRETCKLPPERKTADVERIIVDYLTYIGHYATRQITSGRRIDNRDTFLDAIGRKRTIGSVTWAKGNTKLGKADVTSTIYGITVEIEVKFSKSDKQRESQKQHEIEFTAAGGIYIIVKNFADFLIKFEEVLKHPKIILMKEFTSQ
jgi:hypothetical protein